jgi:CRP-like cAMP-binding protein
MNSYNEDDNTLIVRKKMLFGIDGVILRQGRGRVYHAKAMSACEVYAIKVELFEDLLEQEIFANEFK